MLEGTCAVLVQRLRGIWGYLARREARREAVETYREQRLRDIELETAHTAGTTAIIKALELGGEVADIDLKGRSRYVRMPERPLPPTIQVVVAERERPHHLDGPPARGELTS